MHARGTPGACRRGGQDLNYDTFDRERDFFDDNLLNRYFLDYRFLNELLYGDLHGDLWCGKDVISVLLKGKDVLSVLFKGERRPHAVSPADARATSRILKPSWTVP